jgi:LPXTG-motif cell wall-anchored protein
VGGTAFTGDNATPFAVGAGLLGLVGLSLLYVARRRSA